MKMPHDYKAAYVAGFDDASETDRTILEQLAKEHPEIDGDVKQLEKSDPTFGSSPTEQIIDGLTDFYSDYRNENIHLVGGMHIIALQLSGHPEPEIEAAVLKLRELSKRWGDRSR
ncbi:MAG: hypothetical protein WBE86_15095 [Candidatus Acidiferrales bacterium]